MSTAHFTSDKEALSQLEHSLTHYRIERGIIRLAKGESAERVGVRDAAAIDYLCTEWDYDTDI